MSTDEAQTKIEEIEDDCPPPLEEGPSSTLDGEDEATQSVANLELNKKQDVYKIDYRHQEIDRILGELEEAYLAVVESTGSWDAWLPSEGTMTMVYTDLGYEDEAQFEDAIGGTWDQFIGALPHFEMKVQDEKECSTEGELVLKMRKPKSNGRPCTKILTIKSSEDLWRILYKSPAGTISIPSLEFEMGSSQKRQIDGVYHYISTAIFNLTQHVSQGHCGESDGKKIMETIEQLSLLLDIEEPWDLHLIDKTGISFFDPADDVVIKFHDEEDKKPEETPTPEVNR
eukprot:m.123984 g.123984  ORF g.123984 m.123984 type:complete len:285 (+) comp29030_c0_seq1:152-1006(+)